MGKYSDMVFNDDDIAQQGNYGLRNDGTKKGNGFFGELPMQDGSGKVATELSIGVNLDGQEIEIPSLVPSLSEDEKQYLLKGGKPTKVIVDKAVKSARERMKQGENPFFGSPAPTAESVTSEYKKLVKLHGTTVANYMMFKEHPELTKGQEPKKSWSDMVLNDSDVQQEYTPTGAIDTRTAKPVMQWTPDTTDQAGFGALFKSGWVDSPKAKIQIFAASRFPNLPKAEREAKYKEYDGGIVFLGDDGKYHREVHTDLLSKLRGGVGESIAALPEGVMGAVGAAGGPLTAAIGAAGGEGIRKTVGALAFGEDQDTLGNLTDMAKSGALALGGEAAGRVLTGAVNTAKLRSGGTIKHAVAQDIRRGIISPEDHAKAEFIKTLAETHGVDLAPHQLYNKEGMTNIWKYLRRHPQTSDGVQKFEEKLASQIERAAANYADTLAPEKDIAAVGSDLRGVSKDIVKAPAKSRTAAVGPMYDKAFKDTPTVDISGALSEIDELIKQAPDNSSAIPVFERVKNFFVDKDGNPITELEKINWAKKDVDEYLKDFGNPEISSLAKEKLDTIRQIKEKIIESVDSQSPEYAKARKTYELLTPRVQQVKDSVVGRISRLEGDTNLYSASSQLFNSKMSPKLVAEAKSMVTARNPEMWDQAIAAHFRDTWANLQETESGDLVNAAGKMHKQLFGSPMRREKMKAAMSPEQFQNFEGLMTVFERAAKGAGKESMTAPFQAIDAQLSKSIMTTGEQLAQKPVLTVAREKIFDTWNDITLNGNQQRLFEAMVDSQATRQIQKMKRMSPGSEKLTRSLSVFTAWLFDRSLKADLLKGQEQQGQPQ